MAGRYASLVVAIGLSALFVACGGGNDGLARSTSTPVPPTIPPYETVALTPTVAASGLQTIDFTVGDGAEAQAGDIVYVKYVAWLTDGTLIDVTSLDGTLVPTRQNLREGQVLPGLLEGITGMKVGGKRRLIIPPHLAYGSEGGGNTVPPDATLIYDVELVEVRHP